MNVVNRVMAELNVRKTLKRLYWLKFDIEINRVFQRKVFGKITRETEFGLNLLNGRRIKVVGFAS